MGARNAAVDPNGLSSSSSSSDEAVMLGIYLTSNDLLADRLLLLAQGSSGNVASAETEAIERARRAIVDVKAKFNGI